MKRAVVLLCVFIVGCVTMPKEIPVIQNTLEVNIPFDKAWSAVVETISDMQLPIKAIEKDSGILTTENVTFANGFLADNEINRVSLKPSVFGGVWRQGRYSLNIFVTAIDANHTRIKANSHIEAYEQSITNSWYICHSKGIIESTLFESVKSQL